MGLKEDLDILDAKINKLKVDYEQYFAKILKREPTALRDEIDRIILKYSNQSITNTSLKFRYSTLASKHTSYKQFWNKMLRQIEEGTYVRGAFGARMHEETVSSGTKDFGAGIKPEQAQMTETAPSPSIEIKQESLVNNNKINAVYQQFMEAQKTSRGQSTDMSYEKFTQAIIQQTEKVKKDLKCMDVDYKVIVKDGKVKINIIPKK